ncbi:uncharacterized protein LOC111045032 isoform X2 [Nilaparvata lugens]|nr:uncharacterized protein LOC111045032 isoform X2 [Nilaparvata lugens]
MQAAYHKIQVKDLIKSDQSQTTFCQIPSAPNTNYFQKKSDSDKDKQILPPSSVVNGNAAVVHIECSDKERQSTSFQGEYYMVCYDGKWYPRRNVCVKLCPALSLPNSMFKCYLKNEPVSCEENIRPKTRADRKCKSSHIPDQFSISKNICQDNGEWKHEMTDCVLGHGVLDSVSADVDKLLEIM